MSRLSTSPSTSPSTNGKTSTNGKSPGKPRSPRTETGTERAVRVFRISLTVAMGVGIPLLSLALSNVGGTLLSNGHYPLAALAFGLMGAVLAVSLSHLAWAIGDITRSAPRPSWLLATALDLSLVLCELVHVQAETAGLGPLCWTMMGAVCLFSQALNVYAFLAHREPRSKASKGTGKGTGYWTRLWAALRSK